MNVFLSGKLFPPARRLADTSRGREDGDDVTERLGRAERRAKPSLLAHPLPVLPAPLVGAVTVPVWQLKELRS